MRKWRVGTVSMGSMLIATGILLLGGQFNGINGAILIMRWWPLILIVLGAEILAYLFFSREEQPKLKFDGLSIFLVLLVILASTGVYAAQSIFAGEYSPALFNGLGLYKYESLHNKSYTIDAAKVKSIDIRNSKGNINIEKNEGNSVEIDAEMLIKSNQEQTAVQLADQLVMVREGETLKIETKYEDILDFDTTFQVKVNYTVRVPKEVDYKIRNENGDTFVEGVRGKLTIVSQAGDLQVKEHQGELEAESSSGDIRVENNTGRLKLDQQYGGSIVLKNLSVTDQDIIITSRDGDIRATLPKAQKGTFAAVSQNGEIRCEGYDLKRTPDESEADLNGIQGDSEPRIEERRESGTEFKGILGDPKPRIELKTENGRIDLEGV